MDPKLPLAGLLRKCLVLAYRLKHDAFREWVERELNGYPTDVDVPIYRKATGDIKADVSGVGGAFMSGVAVPLSQIPEDNRDPLRNFDFRESVAALEHLAAGAESKGSSRLMRDIPTELCAKVQIYQYTSTVRMRTELSTSVLRGMLDQVRTRALTFALEVEALNPAAGEATGAGLAIPAQQVSQIFYNVISGGTVNMAASQSVQVAINVQPGDLSSLVDYLRQQGVTDEEVTALKQILPGQPPEEHTPGEKTEGWITRVGRRLGASGGRVAESAVTSVLTAAIKAYLGLP